MVSFAEATVHHVVEHSVGGQTVLENGVLVCPQCHANRFEMQKLEGHFKAYLTRIYAPRPPGERQLLPAEATMVESDENATNRLRIGIDWPALDVDRGKQVIEESLASQTVIRLVAELIKVFGDSLSTQLQELPVVRYPLSKDPAVAFLNPKTGQPFSSLPVPGTNLYFCPQSSTPEKVRRLKELIGRLVLPDERGFPDGSVDVTMVAKP
jgi:hypothetical protein